MLSIHLTVLTWAAGHRDFGVSVSQRLLWYQGRSESLRCSLAKLVPESASGRVMVDAASSVDRLMVDAASSVDCLGIHWQVQRTIKCRALPRSNAGTGWNCSLISDIFQKNKKIPDKLSFKPHSPTGTRTQNQLAMKWLPLFFFASCCFHVRTIRKH